MKKNVLVFGIIAGVIVSSFMAVSMALFSKSDNPDMSGGMVIGFASMAVAFSFVFVGIKNYRDKQNAGVITFGKAFLIGFLISLIASTMYVLTWAVEYHFFMPDFMDKYSAFHIKSLQESGMAESQLNEAIAQMAQQKESYSNPVIFAAYTYMEILPIGILITLISALILRRKSPKI